ncbi:unnamed protein product [Meganyctiphanes norvegica]|uniref:Glycosyltransferase family 92 protein n=1 Tax=Meganyctiphanes norvegica TaxID=48144 RepID=A0AAV2Q3U1_MEGNR
MGRRNSRSRTDSIIFTSSLPDYKVWKPHSQYTLCVDDDDYVSFSNISRVVHFEEFEDIYDDQSFTNFTLMSDHHCHFKNPLSPSILTIEYEGLFFGPETPKKMHNWFGNVSFRCDINRFLNAFGDYLNLYYVETVDYKTNSLSRILITHMKYNHLRHYNPRNHGGPWYIDEDEDHFHLKNARRFDGNDCSRFGHALEFMIEIEEDKLEILFNLCKIHAVNHSDAMSGYRKCRKYRTGSHWRKCPSDWGLEQTRLQLRNYDI